MHFIELSATWCWDHRWRCGAERGPPGRALQGAPAPLPLGLRRHQGDNDDDDDDNDDDTQGSEHTYDGTAYPLEVHIVHYKAAYEGDLDTILGSVDGLAVTGFMFTPGVRIKKLQIA